MPNCVHAGNWGGCDGKTSVWWWRAVAIMLGLTADQLVLMYRGQFAVLRKYEYNMWFDNLGQKIRDARRLRGVQLTAVVARRGVRPIRVGLAAAAYRISRVEA